MLINKLLLNFDLTSQEFDYKQDDNYDLDFITKKRRKY